MSERTTRGEDLRFISYSIAAAMIVVDVTTVLVLGFDYVVPALVAFPDLEAVQALSALGMLAFLVFVQVFFVPVVGFLFDFPVTES